MASSYSPEYGTIDIDGIFHRSGERDARREQTLSKLLDALDGIGRRNQLDGADFIQHGEPDDDIKGPGVSEHLQHVGVEAFNRFQRRVSELDRELRTCVNSARQLGSSVAILSSIFQLRDRLAQISFLFRENAADLYPRKIFRLPRESLMSRIKLPKRRLEKLGRSSRVRRRLPFDKLDVEDFPEQLDLFSRDLSRFLYSLSEFPEFADKAVDAPIVAFGDDLRYWASCLVTYGGELKSPPIQRYIMDLMADMGEHLEAVSAALSMFNEVGIPTIRFAQQHGASNFLNLSTIATFFSAVTATTLQFSYQTVGTALADAVNAFWFTSMVFSIAAAVNSLLGLTWKQSAYRSPSHQVPWWVLVWLKHTPLVFLVVSVACFSIGLVLFAYSSGQNPAVSAITTIFTAFSSFGLVTVSTWFVLERWVFNKHKGSKWLRELFVDIWKLVRPVLTLRQLSYAMNRIRIALAHAKVTLLQRFKRRTAHTLGPTSSWNSLDRAAPDYAHMSPHQLAPSDTTPRTESIEVDTIPASPPASPTSPDGLDPKDSTVVVSPRRARFARALRSMMMRQTTGIFPRHGPTPGRFAPILDTRQEELRGIIRSSRVARLAPLLKELRPTQDFAAHQALVRQLQFSPDGKFLATSSWDQTSVIFSTGASFTYHKTLAHSEPVSQVAWSPRGNFLLTKLSHSIKIWTDAGVCRQSIDRSLPVQSVCWLPGGEAFMSVEGSNVHRLDLTGQELDMYHIERLKIQEVCVMPDGQRLIGYGIITASSTGLRPNKCRAEKQIFVWNLDVRCVETRVPVLHNIRHIALAHNGQSVLVSYESKVPPQLWKLTFTSEWEKVDAPVTSKLTLRHAYIPKVPMEFAGPSYFGGTDDELVLCAGKVGDIHIWDRESASFLHHIRAPAIGGDLTCITWNPAATPFMFATGSHDGTVQIWTSPAKPIPGDSSHSDEAAAVVSQENPRAPSRVEAAFIPDTQSWISQDPRLFSTVRYDSKNGGFDSGHYEYDLDHEHDEKDKSTDEDDGDDEDDDDDDAQSFISVLSQVPSLHFDAGAA